MKQMIISFIVIALLAGLFSTPALSAQLSADPVGFAVAVEQNDTLTQQLTLTNNGDQDLNYKIKFTSPAHGRRDGGPRRDDPNTLRILLLKSSQVNNYGWGDNQWLGVFQNQDPAPRQANINDIANINLGDYDLVGTGENQPADFFDQYTNHRDQIMGYVANGGTFCIFAGCGGVPQIHLFKNDGDIIVGRGDYGDWADVNPAFLNQDHTGLQAGIENELPLLTPFENFRDDQQDANKVRIHMRGNNLNFATVATNDLPQEGVFYYTEQGGNNGAAIVADWPYGSGYVLFTGISGTLFWEQNWLWSSMVECTNLTIWAEGRMIPRWVAADPKEGVIHGGENADFNITFTPGTMAAGTSELLLGVVLGQDANPTIQMSCVMTIHDPTHAISGTVTDPATHQPVEGVTASLDKYLISRNSDANGHYTFDHLPAAAYQVTFSAPDYLPETHNVDLGQDDVALDVGLLHAECNLSQDQVNQDLAPGADTHVQFSVTNGGNGPLTYTNELRLVGDANAAPWDDRRDFNAGATLHDDRIEGVAFDGDHFYFAGANAANPNTIYEVDRDGNETNHYTQLGNSVYGMKDLEFDGELLWGSGETNIYGFRPNGDSVIAFRGPFNPNNNIAYDSDDGLLWISGTTTNIAAYDRQGNAVNRVLNRKGLRIYGLAYWPQDPDGYKLYIFDTPGAGYQLVHKMNTQTGDTMLARSIPVNNGEAPSGIFICNTYDVYSWVMMSMHNIAPANGNDRMSIWQLDARKDWMTIDPTAGVVQAGDHQDFDLHLDATGLPAVQFQGVLVFTHDGVHGETRLPITLNVVAGPVHAERTLHMTQGWNLVSANLQPDNHDVTALTQSLTDQGQLVIMKDGAGHFYLPAQHFNNIPGWDVAQGYFLKLTQDADLTLAGQTVMADDPIELIAGWQAVSYYPRNPVDATVALTGIADHLIIVKDGLGNFYIPSRNFSNMGQMTEGQGYMMKTDASQQLVYHTGNRADLVERASRPLALVTTGGTPVLPHYYPSHIVTGSNMSLLVEASGLEGDVGVYANNVLVGSGAVRIKSDGMLGIAVWGDDPTTEVIDGATEGAALELRLWDGSGERRLSVAVLEVGDLPYGRNVAPPPNGAAGDFTYHTDGLVIASVAANSVPSDFSLTAAYPNPFNSTTRIGFALPTASRVSVRVFDLSGREVATLVSGQLTAGNHTAIWNSEAASAGVYLVKMEAGSYSAVKKLMLVK